METLWQDLRYSLRSMLARPGFTAIAVAALGLGIGANTALFSVVNAALLRDLPYAEAGRLVVVDGNFVQLKLDRIGASAAEFVDYRDQSRSLAEVAAFSNADVNLTDGDQSERVVGARVTASLFPMLRAEPWTGRAIRDGDELPEAERVVVLSHGLWQRRFGSSRDLVGTTIHLDGAAYRVAGIMPSDFEFPHPSFPFAERAELWLPLAFTAEQLEHRSPYNLRVLGRLAPGVSVDDARAEMVTLGARMEAAYPRSYRGPGGEDGGWRITVTPLAEAVVGDVGSLLWILFCAVGLVLAIACANVANLLLARAIARQREIALRVALGAGRWRVVRQLLTESLVLSAAGGAMGLLFALWSNDLLVRLDPAGVPRVGEVGLDARVFAFTIALSIVSGVVFGLAPALHASRAHPGDALKEAASHATGGRDHKRLRSLLVVSEVALSIVLLVGAGLLVRSFVRLRAVDPGFATANVVTMSVALPPLAYPEAPQRASFYERLLARVAAVPGVDKSGATTALPLAGRRMNGPVSVEGRPFDPTVAVPIANYRIVSAGYFDAMGIRLAAGSALVDAPGGGAERAVVNRAFVRSFFPTEEAIGKRIKLGAPTAPRPWLEIAGVVADVKNDGLDAETRPEIYVSYLQEPAAAMTLVVRAGGDPTRIVAAVRREAREVDPQIPLANVATIDELLGDTLSRRRFAMLVLGGFSAIALLLTVIGLYGVMSYTTAQRTREIGVRLVLGARPRDVVRLVVGDGMALAGLGIAIGLASAFGLTRWMESLLFEVSATDPVTFGSVAAALAAVALVACYVPARRATRVDPAAALRHE